MKYKTSDFASAEALASQVDDLASSIRTTALSVTKGEDDPQMSDAASAQFKRSFEASEGLAAFAELLRAGRGSELMLSPLMREAAGFLELRRDQARTKSRARD